MRFRFLSGKMVYQLTRGYHVLLWLRNWWFRQAYGMQLDPSVRVSFKARIDKTNPKQVVIGSHTYVAFDAIILSHDYSTSRHGGQFDTPTKIGKNCFIGCASIILPGVEIGDEVIVGAGSVVSRDVPSNSIVAGNPARVIHSGVRTTEYGRKASEVYRDES